MLTQTSAPLWKKYPDAAFALKILSNLFFHDRELINIHMNACSAILNSETLADARFRIGIWKATTSGTTGTDPMNDTVMQTISLLPKGQQVTAVFDCRFVEERFRITGAVASVDTYRKVLQVKNMAIDRYEIGEIIF